MSDNTILTLNAILDETKQVRAPEMTSDAYFEFFAAEQALMHYQLSPGDIDDGLVGQSTKPEKDHTDGGIDGAYLIVGGHPIKNQSEAQALRAKHKQSVDFDIVIIQATVEQKIELPRLLRFENTAKSIFDKNKDPNSFAEPYNTPLMNFARCFRDAYSALLSKSPKISLKYYYVSKGDNTKASVLVRNKASEIEGFIGGLLPGCACKVEVIGAQSLLEWYRRPRKSEHDMPCLDAINDGKGGHIALVKITDFYKMISNEKGELLDYLFESNVRDYQGAGVTVNKQIRDTLASAPSAEDFWWLNNGVTMIASKVTGDSKQLTVHDPRIVNGLQTSQVIYDYFKDFRLELLPADPRHILVRIIKSGEAQTQDKIIKATNNQTKIPIAYLWATDDTQRNIETVFKMRGMHYDRRKNSWRSVDGMALNNVVSIEQLAQSIGAIFLREPNVARARPSDYFRTAASYRRVFSPEGRSFDAYVVGARLHKAVRAYLKEKEPEWQHRNNLLFYVLMTVVSLHLKVSHPQAVSIAKIDVDKIPQARFDEALAMVRPIYKSCGEDDNAAKGDKIIERLDQKLRDTFVSPKKAK
jgi:hypothetical protein